MSSETVPPGKRELPGVAGAVNLTSCADGSLEISAKIFNEWLVVALVPVMSAATAWGLSQFTRYWGWGIPGGILWVVPVGLLLSRRKSFSIDPHTQRACHILKENVICLELSSGRWLGVRADFFDKKGQKALVAWLREAYGTKMYEIGTSKPECQAETAVDITDDAFGSNGDAPNWQGGLYVGLRHGITCGCQTMAPPGEKAMLVNEKKSITVRRRKDSRLDVLVPVLRTSPMLFVVFLTVVTTWFTFHAGGYLWLLGLLSFFLWMAFIPRIAGRPKRITVEPGRSRACHIRQGGVVCLQLPNGKWVGLCSSASAPDGSRALIAWMKEAYGPRMYEV